MNGKIHCVSCRFYEEGSCHRMPPTLVFNGEDGVAGYPQVNSNDWCGMAKKEDDSCNPESTEYQHQVKIKTLEDKIEFLKDTQTKGNATAGYKPEKSELKPINPPKRK